MPHPDAHPDLLTPASHNLFVDLCEDAPNWSGTPLFQGSKKDTGNLLDLKVKGYITTFDDRGDTFINFTDKGKQLAETLGYDTAELL